MAEKPKPTPTEKPSWWKDEYGEWTENHGLAGAAFQEVLGRGFAPSAAEIQGINAWAGFIGDRGYDAATAQISLSAEAKARGVDPGSYNEAVDVSTLSKKDKEWYDAWAEANPNQSFYSGLLEQLKWQQGLYSVDVYRGMNDGTITTNGNVITVTQEAIDKYGDGKLQFKNGNSGQIVRIPTGQLDNVWIQEETTDFGDAPDGWKDEDWQKWQAEQNSGGYTTYRTSPEKKSGALDFASDIMGDLGLGRDFTNAVMAGAGVTFAPLTAGQSMVAAAPFAADNLGLGDAGYFAADPLNMGSGMAWGSEGAQRNVAGGADLLGVDAADIQMAQSIGQGVVGTAATLLAGPAAGVAFSTVRQANAAAAGQQSWSDAFINTGIAAAASYLAPGADTLGAAFQTAAVQGGTQALQTGLTGTGWDDAAQAGAVAGVASLATAGFNAAIKPQTDWSRAFTGAAVGGGVAYGSGLALGQEGDALTSSSLGAAAQGIISAMASGAARDRAGMEGVSGWQNLKRWGASFKPGQMAGWAGTVRAGDRLSWWPTAHERSLFAQEAARVQSFNAGKEKMWNGMWAQPAAVAPPALSPAAESAFATEYADFDNIYGSVGH